MIYQILGELSTKNLFMTLSSDELVKRTIKSFCSSRRCFARNFLLVVSWMVEILAFNVCLTTLLINCFTLLIISLHIPTPNMIMLAPQTDASPCHVFVFRKNIIVQAKHTCKHTRAFLQKLQTNVDFKGRTHPKQNLEIDDTSHSVSFFCSLVYNLNDLQFLNTKV